MDSPLPGQEGLFRVPAHECLDTTRDGFDGLALVSHQRRIRVAFAPAAGMVGYSLEHDGEELLGQRGGLAAYAERGSTFGIPLLYPWANRLSSHVYTVAGKRVELNGARTPLRLDAHGLPIHGVLAASPHWSVVGRTPGNGHVAIAARLDFAAHEELLAAFPFPHELHVQVELKGDQLTVETIVLPTAAATVPVTFGWHPYLRLPGVPREEWHVELPVRRRALLDERGIPTGETEQLSVEPGLLGTRSFDDIFTELHEPARFVLAGGGRRIELELDEGYPVAQVYAPAGEDFISFEPMTAHTNALVSGEGLRSIAPTGSFRARWKLRVELA